MARRGRRHPAARARRNAAVLSAAAFVGIGTGITAHASTDRPTVAGTAAGDSANVSQNPAAAPGGTAWYAPPVTSTGAS